MEKSKKRHEKVRKGAEKNEKIKVENVGEKVA
jgi:hypothetical protein